MVPREVLGGPGGSLGGPVGSLRGPWGGLGDPWGYLGGPLGVRWGLPGGTLGSLGVPGGPENHPKTFGFWCVFKHRKSQGVAWRDPGTSLSGVGRPLGSLERVLGGDMGVRRLQVKILRGFVITRGGLWDALGGPGGGPGCYD